MSDNKKSILLVDDHKMIRQAIRLFFEEDNQFEIVDEAKDGLEALELVNSNVYDVIITDVEMPVMNGVEFMEKVKSTRADQKILVLSMVSEALYINKMVSLGANGYILKNSSKDEIKDALTKVVAGENYYSKEVYKAIMESIAGKKPKQRLTVETPLSDREKEIIKLITEEYSNKEIADKLFISVRTVDSHKRNIIEKIGCRNIAGLVMYAVERNIV